MRFILLILYTCNTKLSPKEISDAVSDIDRANKIKTTIANPLFGLLFEVLGGLHNTRFYNPKIKFEKKDRREYAKDKTVENDELIEALIRLFPSSAGMVTHMTGSKSNFSKYFLSSKEKLKQGLIYFADIFTAIYNEETILIETDDIQFNYIKEKLMSNNNSIVLFNTKLKELKLLIINSFIINLLDDPNDLKIYLNRIVENIRQHNTCIDSIENKVKEDKIVEEGLSKTLEAYNILKNFPYSKINQPQSNIEISGYSRALNIFINRNEYRFSDCVDITLLHICNCLFYDNKLKRYSLDHLPRNDDSKNLINFYDQYKEYGIFTITEDVRNQWSKVIQDLSTDKIELQDQEEINTKEIGYVKHLKYGDHIIKNELKTGIINMMVVLTRICGISHSEIFEGFNQYNLEERLTRLLQILAVKQDGNNVITVYINNITKFNIQNRNIGRKYDFSGEIFIVYDYPATKDVVTVEINHSSIHAYLSLISNVPKNIKTIDVDGILSQISNKTDLKFVLIKKCLELVSENNNTVNEIINKDNAYDELFLSKKIDTNEIKIEYLERIFETIYSLEKNRIESENIFLEEIKNVMRLIVSSLTINDEATLRSFMPFFLYTLELISDKGNLNIEKLILCWINSIKLEENEKLAESWGQKMIEIGLKSLDISGSMILTKGVLIASKTIEKLTSLTNLNISNNMIGKEGANKISEALKKLRNLESLNISWNKIEDCGAIRILESLENPSKLKSLNISCNKIENVSFNQISKFLKNMPNLTLLDISNNNFGTDGTVEFSETVKDLTNLEVLNISNLKIPENDMCVIFSSWKNLKNLKSLDVSSNPIGNKASEVFSKVLENMNHLEHLNIANIKITEKGARIISEGLMKLNKLISFDISVNIIESNGLKEIINGLKNSKNLQSLNFSYTDIKDESVIYRLIKNFPNLTNLIISNNNFRTETLNELKKIRDGNQGKLKIIF